MLFASAGLDGKIVFFDIAHSKIVKTLSVQAPLQSMTFHDDGVTVAVVRGPPKTSPLPRNHGITVPSLSYTQ